MSVLGFANGYTGYANVPSIRLTERLLELTYPNMTGIFYANSGSEANDFAMKAAALLLVRLRQAGEGQDHLPCRLISWRHARGHGDHGHGAIPQGLWPRTTRIRPGADVLSIPLPVVQPKAVVHASNAPTTSRPRFSGRGPRRWLRSSRSRCMAPAASSRPTRATGPRLREICDRQDVLLIADEVITGFGRTGRWFALERWGVQPDMLTFAKAVTSAYVPLSGFIASKRVHDAILEAPADTKFMIGCTNSAHPTACAVALRNLQIFDDEGLVERAERMGERLNAGLAGLLEMPNVGNVRGLGLMAAVEVVADRATRRPFDAAQGVGLKIAKEMRARRRRHPREGRQHPVCAAARHNRSRNRRDRERHGRIDRRSNPRCGGFTWGIDRRAILVRWPLTPRRPPSWWLAPIASKRSPRRTGGTSPNWRSSSRVHALPVCARRGAWQGGHRLRQRVAPDPHRAATRHLSRSLPAAIDPPRRRGWSTSSTTCTSGAICR